MTSGSKSLVAAFALGMLLTVGGAAFGETRHAYTPEQVRTIVAMRNDGASLAQVAKSVGGTRDDVRAVERAEKVRARSETSPSGVLAVLGLR
jgi:hypothetical protein